VVSRAPEASVIIAAAAVADFRVSQASAQKIKRNGPMSLEVEPTRDILAEVASQRRPDQLLIGFAAETQNTIENGRTKLRKKGIDAIVVNDVSNPQIGFDSECNEVTILTSNEEIPIARAEKSKIAHRILDAVLKLKTHTSKAVPAR